MKTILTLAFLFGFSFAQAADEKKADAKFDAEKMVGKWKMTDGKMKGKAIEDEKKKGLYEITKDKIHIKGEDGKDAYVMKYTVDAKASPATIDMEITVAPVEAVVGSKTVGIVSLDGDTLKITYDPTVPTGKDRPTKFDDDKAHCFTLKREKEEKKKEEKK
jgi:uncharacterized protein (TIGR03067 family)